MAMEYDFFCKIRHERLESLKAKLKATHNVEVKTNSMDALEPKTNRLMIDLPNNGTQVYRSLSVDLDYATDPDNLLFLIDIVGFAPWGHTRLSLGKAQSALEAFEYLFSVLDANDIPRREYKPAEVVALA